MNPYDLVHRNHDHFAHMSQIEDHRHAYPNRPAPLDDLVSSATLKIVNSLERGWHRMAAKNRR